MTYSELIEPAIAMSGISDIVAPDDRKKFLLAAETAVRKIYDGVAPYCSWALAEAASNIVGDYKNVFYFRSLVGPGSIFEKMPNSEEMVYLQSEDARMFNKKLHLANVERKELFDVGFSEVVRTGRYPDAVGFYAMSGNDNLVFFFNGKGIIEINNILNLGKTPTLKIMYTPSFRGATLISNSSQFAKVGSKVERESWGRQRDESWTVPLDDEYFDLAVLGAQYFSIRYLPSMARKEVDAAITRDFEEGLRHAVSAASYEYFAKAGSRGGYGAK